MTDLSIRTQKGRATLLSEDGPAFLCPVGADSISALMDSISAPMDSIIHPRVQFLAQDTIYAIDTRFENRQKRVLVGQRQVLGSGKCREWVLDA